MNSRFLKLYVLVAALVALNGCSTMTEMVESNMPNRHSGRPSIAVSLAGAGSLSLSREPQSRVVPDIQRSEGYQTPVGHFRVIRKDIDHRSSLYGDYVDASGRIVRANVDSRRDRKPPHSHFVGAPMPYFLEFSPGYGLHQGYLPGVPASHGCIRLPYWKARQFYDVAYIGTPVIINP